MFVSVIIPTYNPAITPLKQTVESLKNQTLDYQFWELILIDNNSSFRVSDQIDLTWHPDCKSVIEFKQGLTFARLKGFTESRGDIIVMVDDDNVLEKNYLSEVIEILRIRTRLGAVGGKSIPIFESREPEWLHAFYDSLAIRDLGDNIKIEEWQNQYPSNAPIGAGMAIKKTALLSYIRKLEMGKNIISDRKGSSLSSGGDNDIIIEILKSGWQTGYFPTLLLYHLIPKERLSVNYLARLANASNKSWIELLESHGINPWPKISRWTLPFRKFKAWFTYKAWLNKVGYIKWRGVCGSFDGLSAKI